MSKYQKVEKNDEEWELEDTVNHEIENGNNSVVATIHELENGEARWKTKKVVNGKNIEKTLSKVLVNCEGLPFGFDLNQTIVSVIDFTRKYIISENGKSYYCNGEEFINKVNHRQMRIFVSRFYLDPKEHVETGDKYLNPTIQIIGAREIEDGEEAPELLIPSSVQNKLSTINA